MEAARRAVDVARRIWTHEANRGARARALVRAVAFQANGRVGRRWKARLGERSRLWVDLHDHAAARVVYFNPPDLHEMRHWRSVLRPGDLFVDVGANVGFYSVWAAEAGASVVACEPDPQMARKLRENAQLNRYPIDVRQVAVAAQAGVAWFTVGLGSQNRLSPTADAATREVRVTTLDDIIGNRYVAGVKIDVEGAERDVLAGAERALSEHRISLLQIEFDPTRPGFDDLLRDAGYSTFRLPGMYDNLFAAPDNS